jgi:flagellar hook-associated protein 1 FlgK
MSVLMGALNIARNALMANQRALAITAQNIANVNTVGYARQEVIFGSSAISNGEVPTDHQGPLGMGVLISDVRRSGGSMNAVLEERIAMGASNLGRLQARAQLFGRVESILNDASATGLNRVLSDFFNAAQDLSNDPSNAAAREVLLERARTLADRFVTADTQINQVSDDATAEIESLIREVNAQTAQIAKFNDLIATGTSSGQDVSGLRNQRRLVMNDLAEKIGFTSVEDPLNLGKVTLTVDSVPGSPAIVLVNAGTDSVLSTTRLLTTADITPSISNGRLGGLANMRGVVIPALKTDLDQLASTLVNEVNARHVVGFDLLGVTGANFFSGTSAATMSVAIPVSINDYQQVAASSTITIVTDPITGLPISVPGNNDIMRSIAVLQNTSVIPVGGAPPTATLQEFYDSVVSKLGADVQDADSHLSAENVIQDELAALRDETSGVSIDDELINVVKFQRAFEAAARLVNVTDEMLQTLISLKR